MPAIATAPVPWMSSLKQQILSRYLSNKRKALVFPKSSNWINTPGKCSCAASINSSSSESNDSPRSRCCSSPLYSGSFSNASLLVPTSSMTGRHSVGWIPAQAVYSDNLPMGIPIPSAPRSPRPRILSPSVMTMMRAFLCGQLFKTSFTLPRSREEI